MIYENEYLNEISFPLGGIGTGCIGLTGSGRLQDFEIFNRPNKGSLNGYSAFYVRAVKDGKVYTKALCGDVTKDLTGFYQKRRFGGFGYGPAGTTLAGFPHFKNVTFKGEFPIAEITFTDPDFPGKVILRAFNPFIPLDSFNSSIPCAIFDILFENDTDSDVEYTAAISFQNPFNVSKNTAFEKDGIRGIKMFNAGVDKDNIEYGDLSIVCTHTDAFYQKYWF